MPLGRALLPVLLMARVVGAAAEEPSPAAAAAEAKSPEPETRPVTAPPEPAPDSIPPASTKDRPSAKGLAPFRLQLDARIGLGDLAVRDSTEYEHLILSGMSMPVGLSVGVSLTRALVVFAEIGDSHMLLFNSETSYGASELDLYGAGLGLKYYLTPEYFLSGSASIARLQLWRGDSDMEISRWGAMARVSAGREWPVSSTWSIAIAGEYQFGVVQSRGLDWGYAYDPVEGRYRLRGFSLLVLTSFHQPGGAEVTGAPPAGLPASTPALPAPSDKGLAPFGFYLDARVGLGGLWTRVGDGFWTSGVSIPLALSAGINITKALVAFGELADIHVLSPACNLGDEQLFSLDLYGAGLGLKYYLTPRRFFLSGSVSLARLQYRGIYTYLQERISETSHWGALGRVSAGRAWPVSPNWSMGVAGELQLGRMATGTNFYNNNYGDDSYTLKGLSLLALATFDPPAQREPAGPGNASAPATLPVGHHTHDGVYANASVGAGWLWLRNRRRDQVYEDPDYQLSGRGTLLALSVGYAFANRFVVFGELSALQVHDPAGDSDIATLEWYGLGPGLKYYLMPANVFVSGSLLVSRVGPYNSTPGDSRYGIDRTSKWGATGRLSLGKEWWVLGDLGVGVAGELGFGKMAGNDDWLTYTVKELSLLASVSFN
jgi:hypothetical protein